jgi:hypothetical protein
MEKKCTQQLWPKVSFFLWLLRRGKIMTWENLLKRGFQGPTYFHLCHNNEENIKHFFNNCPFSSTLWDQATLLFKTLDHDRNNT